ncbi:MAG: FAD-dependent oxidoreductase, partial [Alphaproteobacteria bacterium]|nr:FAD-dependent oxidoreductase [Alphaproteobacteria bacterium]
MTKPEPGDRSVPQAIAAAGTTHGTRPRVVIIGAGFAGLNAAHALAKAPVDVTLIDRRNYHLFQPLLYQVATAGLSPADIATPIRSIFRHQKNVTVLLGRVTAIDKTAQYVEINDRHIPYDILIVATGARHGYFGHPEWEGVAPGLKKIEDATTIRRRILLAFEEAENAMDPVEHRRLLNFVIIGGGPTGVELAGAIAELAKVALAMDFRHIDPREARIILVEAGPRVLATFPERLSAVAKAALEKLGAWQAAEPKFAMAESVRAALTLVARSEAVLGIV